jgi:hypothetical protein
LSFPGDVAHGFGLPFLTHLQVATDLSFEAIGPGRFCIAPDSLDTR